jgi:RNA polymerase sigma-70 factor, ECF subfamily
MDIERFRRGDPDCLEEVLKTHRQVIWRAVRRFAESPDDFWDLTQMVAVRVWEGCESYRGQAPLESWLYCLAANTCRDERRRRGAKRRGERQIATLGALKELQWQPPAPSSGVYSQEVWALARKALPQLPSREREAFELCIMKRVTYEEAALDMEVEVATVRSLVRKARAKLRLILRESLA